MKPKPRWVLKNLTVPIAIWASLCSIDNTCTRQRVRVSNWPHDCGEVKPGREHLGNSPKQLLRKAYGRRVQKRQERARHAIGAAEKAVGGAGDPCYPNQPNQLCLAFMVTPRLQLDLAEMDGRAGRLPLVGGALCLNFANTVTGLHEGEHEHDHLRAYEHIVAWGVHAEAIQPNEARLLLRRAAEDGAAASRAHHRALALREVLHEVFAGVAHRRPAPERALEALNAALA